MNELYRLFFYEKDILKHSDDINLVRDVIIDSCEVIYIGESSNITFRGDDIDKRPISSFIADYFSDLKIGNITKPASHAGIYYELLNQIPQDSKVKTVIVTLNLRSFNAEWIYSKLETPLQKGVVLLKEHPPLWNRFLLSFKGYDIKTEYERSLQIHYKWRTDVLKFPYSFPYKNVPEWDNAMACAGVKKEDGSYDEELTPLACHFIKTYAFQIDTLTNPRIKDFDKIVQLAKNRNWNLVFNLMAENVEMADSLVGKDLMFLMKQNRDLLVNYYQRKGVMVVDNFSAVEDKEFVDRNWPTEHYAEQGRKIVARNVAQSIETLYPDYYQDIQYSTQKKSAFFHNCDNDDTWTQWHTITREQAFSGSKSSKTGKGNDYGLTFEYGIKNLPDSLTTVFVEMQIYQQGLAHDAQIVLEITGKRTLNFPIKNAITETNSWQKVNCQFELDEDFYDWDIVKVFLYNPSNTVIYCDDIRVVFE
jgi:hypothetical protein